MVVLTGYNRNSKFDLVANGLKAAQKLRIGRLLRDGGLVDSDQLIGTEIERVHIPLWFWNARTTKGSFVPSDFVFRERE